MFNKLKYIFFLVLALLTITNCEKKSEEIITVHIDQDGINQWMDYLNELGHEGINNSTVVLFARSVDCKKYENEIKWWDENISDLYGTDLILIILEKYDGYFESPKSVLDVQIQTYQDDSFNVLDNEMIPFFPSKIFIDYNNKRIVVGKMGTSQSIKNFLETASNY